jgi:hypothetical protein
MSHDFDILIVVGPADQHDEVEQDRQRLRKKKADHGGRCCREYADEQSATWSLAL